MPEKPQSKKEINLELFECWKANGDDRIITENLPFIYSVADGVYFGRSSAQRARISKQEVRQEGVIGWMIGLKKFDKAKGYAVTTYGGWWVYAYALAFCKAQHPIRLDTTNEKSKAIVALNRDAHRFLDENGKEDLQKLSEASGIALDVLEEMKEALQSKFYCLDTQVFQHDSNPSVNCLLDHQDDIESNTGLAHYYSSNNPESLLDKKQRMQFLQDSKEELIKQYGDKPVFVDLINFFILPENEPLTLEQIAHLHGYPHKQNVGPWKDKLVELLSKKFMERYNGYKKTRADLAVHTGNASQSDYLGLDRRV